MIEIPVKYVYDRNSERSKALLGDARRVMAILENMMRLRGLNQLSITMEPYPGALIRCAKVFGARTAVIETGGAPPPEEWSEKQCVCNCNFTEGWILRLQEEKLDDEFQLYTVMACVGTRYYRQFENVLASDFTVYTEAQKVLLIPYYQMAFLCCNEAEATGAKGCSPKVSDDELVEETWRTSHRIIPWCGLNVPKWVKQRSSANGNMRRF